MIGGAAREALHALGDIVGFDVPLARYTSLRVGGPADALAQPRDVDDLERILGLCHEHGLPHVVLGGGFNTLVRDAGIAGVVLRLGRLRGLEAPSPETVRAECGVSHHRLTRYCRDQGLAGLEFGAGIPGTVGGWIAMNAGIPEREVGDAIVSVEWLAADGSALRRSDADAFEFRYRELRGLPAGAVIVAGVFAVEASSPEHVAAEVARHLAKRAGTQPLDVPSCGSVFTNPAGDHAGRLIEAAGLKGLRVGAAEISTVHANFIVNRGGATATDVIELIERVRDTVTRESGIRLETEVRIVGRPEA